MGIVNRMQILRQEEKLFDYRGIFLLEALLITSKKRLQNWR